MIGWLKRIGAWLVSRKVELGLGIRVTVAAMSALVIALACGLKLPLWAVLTAIIVLLLPAMSHGNPLDSAIDRVLEVAVGAITGLAVSFLVLPSRAHSQIRLSAARVLELLAAVLDQLLSGLTRGRDNDTLHSLQDGIGTAIAALNALGAEAERERAAKLSSGPDTGPLLRTILRLRHDIVIIGRASVVPLPVELLARLAAPLAAVSGATTEYLKTIAAALRSGRGAPAIWPVQSALEAYAAAVAAVRAEGLTRGLSGDVIEHFFALGFSLEQMRQNLKDLERCVSDWSESSDMPAIEPDDGIN